MGDKQCAFCGHITTGFEHQEWEAAQHATECLKARIADLESQLSACRDDRAVGAWHIREITTESDSRREQNAKEMAGRAWANGEKA